MTQIIGVPATPLQTFTDKQSAENALAILQDAGFPTEQLEIVPQNPTLPETEVRKSSGQGAIAGSLLGASLGLLASYLKISVVNQAPQVDPTTHIIGMVLVGSLIGAVGIGIIVAMSGVNILRRQQGVEESALTANYLLLSKELSDDKVSKIKAILQQLAMGDV